MIMASIRELSTGRTLLLEPEHLIGRAPSSALHLEQRYASVLHAALRWTGERWELRDLGSRNGTFVDGIRLKAGEAREVVVGSKLSFGRPEEVWEVLDVSAPRVMAVPVDGGDPVVLDRDLLALPSTDNPQATIFRSADGTWTLEHLDDSTTPIANLQTFEVAGRIWRFCCDENIGATWQPDSGAWVAVRHLQLTFAVSRDEEHVELQITCAGKTWDLGSRTHNYLLLTLARRRLADAADGLPETSRGWIYQEDLAHDPSMAAPQLNIGVFRIRQQLAGLGIADAAGIIERRPRTHQLRIGTGHIRIAQL
jgi:hypothetical protein